MIMIMIMIKLIFLVLENIEIKFFNRIEYS